MQFDDCKVTSRVRELRVPGTATRLVCRDRELDPVARGHAEHLQHAFERAEVELDRQDASAWVAEHGQLIDQVRAALDWAFSSAGDASIGVGLTIATIPLWILCAQPNELCRRVERALESKAAATRSAREMQLRAAASLARMGYASTGTEAGEDLANTITERPRESGRQPHEFAALRATG